MGVMAEGTRREMMSDITVSEKTVWLTHHIEGVEYICSISYNKLEPRQLGYHKVLVFSYLQMIKTMTAFISILGSRDNFTK